MQIITISEQEGGERLNQPYNPPALGPELDKEQFEGEWLEVRNGLQKVLDGFGEFSDYGDADYCMGTQMTLSRGIGFEITSSGMLKKNLIPAIQAFLKSIPANYEIYTSPTFPDEN